MLPANVVGHPGFQLHFHAESMAGVAVKRGSLAVFFNHSALPGSTQTVS